MTILCKADNPQEIAIDLTGPDGNAFVLMGIAKGFARDLGQEPNRIDALIKDMMSGDYENLVTVFDNEFGSFVTLLR